MEELAVADVGVERFNRDHQRLLFYVQEFTSLCDRFRQRTPFPDEWDQVDLLFRRLEDYTRNHFRSEEGELSKIGFPALSAHQQQHQYFVDVLTNLKTKVVNREFRAIGTVETLLIDWIVNHINQTDVQYRTYLSTEST
ncbi:MAG: hemerythrin family protein [Magnetococcales bacterium]|nr:hemerythrin family protein [Magnetococcales bacterium]